MQIVCPHCQTSYDIRAEALGPQGRQVRCTRCQQVWRAMPDAPAYATSAWEEAPAESPAPPSAAAVDAPRNDPEGDRESWETNPPVWDETPPHIDSPPIAGSIDTDFAAAAPAPRADARPSRSFGRKGMGRLAGPAWQRLTERLPVRVPFSLNAAVIAMATLAIGLMIWRADVVRALPQTAGFFKMIGFGVNLRGLDFANVRMSTETVNGASVLVIEGDVIPLVRKPMELPRLRFAVHNAKGQEIYAWNAVLEQPALAVDEKIAFRSRLESPPAEAREVAVRFFHRRDLASGGT